MDLGISVICSTNRINMIENILENFLSQDYPLKELIILLNIDLTRLDNIIELISSHDNIKIYNLGSKLSLGECLNYGVEKSNYPIIAKFDDDDYYGSRYLSDSVKFLNLEGVGIVGKSCIFVYFSEEGILAIQNIDNENKYVNRVSGSTLLFKKELFDKIRFQNINLGEDINFCNDCKKIGYKVYSTNKFHYVYIRNNRNKHTWKMYNGYILKNCTQLCKIDNYKELIDNIKNNK